MVQFVHNELERIWKAMLWSVLRWYASICI